MGEKGCPVIRDLYFPSEGRRAEGFFAVKNPKASVGFEPANLGINGQHATSRPPKPLFVCVCVCCKTATWQGYRMSMYTAFDGAYLVGVATQMTCIKWAYVI
jgi:hypothetical protein